MHLTTGHLQDGNVVAAEPRHRVHLLALAELLTKAQLALFVVTPREDLGELLLLFLGLFVVCPLHLKTRIVQRLTA